MMDGRMGRFTAFIVASLGVFGSYGDPPGTGGGGEAGIPAIQDYAWCDGTTYRPPDFNRYFPDSEVGARALEALWNAPDRDRRGDCEILEAARGGLKRYTGDRTALLRWIGNRYIWNQKPQHGGAIELMYHASDCPGPNADPHGTRGPAIYFGLSVVRPMTPAILRTLVEIAVRVDDPNDLSRIAWGAGDQRDEALAYLEPFLASPEPAVREKARVVGQILNREKKAFAWSREKLRDEVAESFQHELPRIAEALANGDSNARRTALESIEQNQLVLIMDDRFLRAFWSAAEDGDAKIRRAVARIVGEHWVWSAKEAHPEATELLLQLSADPDRDVRYNSVYYGLSAIPGKDQHVIRRLLELALADRDPDLYGRILWGLRSQHKQARAQLEAYRAGSDPQRAVAAGKMLADLIDQGSGS